VLFSEDRADETDERAAVREDPGNMGPSADLAVERVRDSRLPDEVWRHSQEVVNASTIVLQISDLLGGTMITVAAAAEPRLQRDQGVADGLHHHGQRDSSRDRLPQPPLQVSHGRAEPSPRQANRTLPSARLAWCATWQVSTAGTSASTPRDLPEIRNRTWDDPSRIGSEDDPEEPLIGCAMPYARKPEKGKIK
jgi:hypothetical protein